MNINHLSIVCPNVFFFSPSILKVFFNIESTFIHTPTYYGKVYYQDVWEGGNLGRVEEDFTMKFFIFVEKNNLFSVIPEWYPCYYFITWDHGITSFYYLLIQLIFISIICTFDCILSIAYNCGWIIIASEIYFLFIIYNIECNIYMCILINIWVHDYHDFTWILFWFVSFLSKLFILLNSFNLCFTFYFFNKYKKLLIKLNNFYIKSLFDY